MVRLDRLASVYIARPLVGKRSGPLRIPVLMYHSISGRVDYDHPYYRTTTTPAAFREQMQYLKQAGYSTLTVSEALACLDGRREAAGNPVAITFDDGYRDFYAEAFPVLAELGFTASMYLPTGYIGEQPALFQGIGCMNWSQVRELQAAGIEFGSHTVTHPRLVQLEEAAIRRELGDSKAAIEDRTGRPAATFAYPYAFPETRVEFVARLREILRDSGYEGGVCTAIGTATPASDRYFLPRLPANAADDRELLRAKLEGGYDWLRGLQRLQKSFRERS